MPKKVKSESQKYGWYKRDLRMLWNRSPMKWEAYNRAKLKPAYVRCENCNKETYWKLAEVDHKQPVVAVDEGPKDVATYAARLNCASEGLQVLCETCHQAKSKNENSRRKRGQ
jgi:hypothetical protein